jgi:methylglutaconyl-CoA hydratase
VSAVTRRGERPSPVRLERTGPRGAVARVTIARPEVRNALDAAAIAALRDAFDAFAAEPAEELRAVVLGGDGPTFCAGGDLGWMRGGAALSGEENVRDTRALAAMYDAIDACPVPVIARVQGAALGGGAGLCCVADVVVAEATATFGFPEVRIGLLPATVAPFAVARLGEGNARALFVTGRRIDAREALRVGLVHEIATGPEALDAAVSRCVDEVLAGGATGVRAAKALVLELRPQAPGSAADRTAQLLADQRASAEGIEGLAAAADRRPPAWARPDDG